MDNVVPFSCSKELKRHMPSATLIVKKDTGHAIVVEHEPFVSEMIVAFLNQNQ